MSDQEEATALVLPFYMLVDVSWSMTQDFGGQTGIEAVNAIAPEIAELFESKPVIRDKVRFGMLSFAGDAQVEIPLCDIADLQNIPVLTDRADGTSYANALRKMKAQIELDVATLKAGSLFKVHRPAVFFLTDGAPTDQDGEWQTALDELTDSSFKARPNLVPFGVMNAEKAVLDQLARYKVKPGASPRAFVQSGEVSAAAAISSMLEMLTGSILNSANDVADNGMAGTFQPPEDNEDDDAWL